MTIYLGKGTHFFFACFDGLSANVTPFQEVTDFCSEIASLKPAYMKADNMKLTVKPLDCKLISDAADSKLQVFKENCVDLTAPNAEIPLVMINSAFVNCRIMWTSPEVSLVAICLSSWLLQLAYKFQSHC